MKTRPFYRLVAALLCIFLILQHVPASVLAAGTEDIGMQDEHSTATSSATNDAPKSSEGFASSAAVTSELTEGRTENEKRYRLEDGSYTAVVYQEPVHVRDSSGILQEIVNKLTLDETEGRYTVTIGDVEKDYAASMSAGDLLRVSKGAYELAMSPVEETIEKKAASEVEETTTEETTTEAEPPVPEGSSEEPVTPGVPGETTAEETEESTETMSEETASAIETESETSSEETSEEESSEEEMTSSVEETEAESTTETETESATETESVNKHCKTIDISTEDRKNIIQQTLFKYWKGTRNPIRRKSGRSSPVRNNYFMRNELY